MITLCPIDEIEESTSKGFEVERNYMFAVKKDDQIFLYWNRCPHLGTPLEWLEDKFLDNDNALIQCSTHGALFVIDTGECIHGPCHGRSLQAIPFSIEDGNLVISEDVLPKPHQM